MIPSFLTSWLAKGILAAVLLAGAAGFIGYYNHLISENARLTDSLRIEEQTNKADQDALAKIKADYAKAQAAIEASQQETQARAQQKAQVERVINHATDKDDGPVAPVLRDTIGQLYDYGASGGQDSGGAAAGSR